MMKIVNLVGHFEQGLADCEYTLRNNAIRIISARKGNHREQKIMREK